MPSFEPSFFRTTLTHLEEERENTYYSKCNFEEHWETLRAQWNDAAGRNVDTRNMTALVDVYAQALSQSQQHIETTKQCGDLFDSLRRLLIDAAHHHEQYNRLFGQVSNQSEERDRSLRSSENLTKQVEVQQEHIADKKRSANSHVGKI
ncbi:hypothetical protein [Vibrio intestinalis]|uniref:hypothetical protein n=1 Tax=Vibrio intestinalis TaxID=2933291 RepID=UPI0021A8B67B|nr:hypothetical protein [Vibrio intestinalis]